jgi:hypothetical protein
MSRPTLEVADIFPVRGEGACIGKTLMAGTSPAIAGRMIRFRRNGRVAAGGAGHHFGIFMPER